MQIPGDFASLGKSAHLPSSLRNDGSGRTLQTKLICQSALLSIHPKGRLIFAAYGCILVLEADKSHKAHVLLFYSFFLNI